MQYFDFKRLINKYSRSFVMLIPTDGYYNDSGDWETGKPLKVDVTGAIISTGNRKMYRSDGTLHQKDMILHMLQPITYALEGARVFFNGDVYGVESDMVNAEFTGVYSYILRYVSAFKDFRPDYDITDYVDMLDKRLDGVLVEEKEPIPEPDLSEYSGDLEKRLDGVLDD